MLHNEILIYIYAIKFPKKSFYYQQLIHSVMRILFVFLLFLMVTSCEKSKDVPKYTPPADHTISKDGTMHKTGLDQPQTNCAVCHGSDLQGGTTGVSCFECHDKEW